MRDQTDETYQNRRDYLKATGIAAASTVGLAGCLGGADATGTLATSVTDQPGDIADFESCVVTIQGIWLKPSGDGGDGGDGDGGGDGGDGGDGDGGPPDDAGDDATDAVETQDEDDVDQGDGRTYHEFDEPQEADLVDLQGDNTQLVDDREVEAQEYQFLQLDVSGVDATLEGGESADVGTPGEAPLQFKEPFEIREDQRTTFVADFTPVKRGGTGSYLLQPVATGTEVRYEDADEE